MYNRLLIIAVGVIGLCLGWLVPAGADPVTGDLFYTRFSGTSRVETVTFSFDGTTFSLGAPTSLASGIGADGITGNPNDPGSLLVGGQGSVVHRVSTSGAGVISSTAVPVSTFHLEVADSTTMYIMSIPGTPGRVTLNPDGTLGASVALTPAGGPDALVSQIITTPSGDFYTTGGAGGFGNFGTISFAVNTFTTTRLYGAGGSVSGSTLPAAHGGVYDPFTGDIILFGDDHITQLNLLGAIISDLTVPLFLNLDQGTVDGAGHVFAASNSGHLVFLDYNTSGLVADGGNFFANPFLASALDDVAPLVGAGATPPPDTTTVPVPSTLLLLGSGLVGLGFSRRVTLPRV